MRARPYPMRGLLALASTLAFAACADESPLATAPEPYTPAASVLGSSGGTVVVFAEEAVPSEGLDLIASLGGTVTSRHDAIGVVFVVGLDDLARATLAASPLVDDVGPDYTVDWLPGLTIGEVVGLEDEATTNDHDPARASRFRVWQWGPQRIAADQAWAAGYRSNSSIRVAILDTGIDFLHRELRGLVDLDASASFVPEEPTFDDLHFHGTHVASTVATHSITVAGIAPHTTLIAVKVLSFLGSGTFEGVIGGIMHAADVADAHVINMSLGAVFDRRLDGADALIKAMQRSIQHAGRQGTLVVSAAGNDAINLDDAGAPLVSVPCMVSHLCISATGPLNGQFDASGPILTENHDQPAYYTNHGFSAIDVAAPGGNADPNDPDQVQGTWRSEDLIVGACAGRSTVVPQCAVNNDVVAFYIFAGGTSMATPHVAGAAAMIQAANGGSLTVDQLIERITSTADDVGAAGADIYSNHGRINVMSALR